MGERGAASAWATPGMFHVEHSRPRAGRAATSRWPLAPAWYRMSPATVTPAGGCHSDSPLPGTATAPRRSARVPRGTLTLPVDGTATSRCPLAPARYRMSPCDRHTQAATTGRPRSGTGTRARPGRPGAPPPPATRRGGTRPWPRRRRTFRPAARPPSRASSSARTSSSRRAVARKARRRLRGSARVSRTSGRSRAKGKAGRPPPEPTSTRRTPSGTRRARAKESGSWSSMIASGVRAPVRLMRAFQVWSRSTYRDSPASVGPSSSRPNRVASARSPCARFPSGSPDWPMAAIVPPSWHARSRRATAPTEWPAPRRTSHPRIRPESADELGSPLRGDEPASNGRDASAQRLPRSWSSSPIDAWPPA